MWPILNFSNDEHNIC